MRPVFNDLLRNGRSKQNIQSCKRLPLQPNLSSDHLKNAGGWKRQAGSSEIIVVIIH